MKCPAAGNCSFFDWFLIVEKNALKMKSTAAGQ
jgi:hypothetical protein